MKTIGFIGAYDKSDLIIYIEDKHIEEMGTHEELLKLNGKYSKLFMSK